MAPQTVGGILGCFSVRPAVVFRFEAVEIFHNRKRRHSSLGMLSPIEYDSVTPTPPPAIKQADRAKPRAHESLQEIRGDSEGRAK